jgi:NitT/TauT family transport system permease protein
VSEQHTLPVMGIEETTFHRRGAGASAYVAPALTLLATAIVWELAARYFQIPGWLLPTPSAIGEAMVDWRVELLRHTLVTLYETLMGFGLALAFGVPLAALVTYSPLLQKTIYPLLLALQSVPKVAVAPLLALWIGFGALPKIVVVFLVCFFPIIVATAAGLSAVPATVMELIRSLSASQYQIFTKIRFPTALPHIFVGSKIAITFAVIGAVIGEFVGSESGLGYVILTSSSQLRTSLAFAALVILTLMSILLYYAVELAEGLCLPWVEKS